MKKFYVFIVVALFYCATANAQTPAPGWVWAKRAAGTNYFYNEVATSAKTDASGNIYTVGYFSNNAVFGATTLSNGGMFIAKYNSSGTVLWAKKAGLVDDKAYAVTISGSFIYVVGIFKNPTIVFGANTTLTNTGTANTSNIFVAKYDPNGNVVWAKKAEGYFNDNNDVATSVSADTSGNIYVAGYYYSHSIIFGADTLHNTTTNVTKSDLFLVKYDANGNALWAKSTGGTTNDIASSVTVDRFGNIYMVGYCSPGPATFDSITVNINANTQSMYIVKYNGGGHALWVKLPVGNVSDASSVATDTLGNIYVTGGFQYSVIFGSDTLKNISLGYTMYTVKYDNAGTPHWAKMISGVNDYVISTSITADVSGGIYVAAYTNWSSIIFNKDTLQNHGNEDMFIVKYNNAGNPLWAKGVGGTDDDHANSVTIDNVGNIYAVGSFQSPTIPFGSTTLANSGTTWGYDDMFIAKIYPVAMLTTSTNVTCNGGNNGSATITPQYGNPPYTYSWNTAPVQTTSTAINLSAGTYTVTVKDALNAVLKSVFTIIQPAAMTASMSIANASSCVVNDGSVSANISGGTSPYSYSWNNGGTTSVITGLAQGVYTLTVTDTKGCTKTATATVTCPTGVEELPRQTDFIISPNPNNGIFSIETQENEYELIVFSVLGEKLLSQRIQNNKSEIDLSKQPAGIYFLSFKIKGATFVRELILQK